MAGGQAVNDDIGLGGPAYIAERLAHALWARQILHSHWLLG